MHFTNAEWAVLCVIVVPVFGFFGWCVYTLKNPDYLARLKKEWAPKEYHTS